MNKTTRPSCLALLALILLVVSLLTLVFGWTAVSQIPDQAEVIYGPSSPNLNNFQKIRLSYSLIQNQESLLTPVNPAAEEVTFLIEVNQSTTAIIENLYLAGLIPNRDLFRNYLVYSGLDTQLQAGEFQLSAGINPVEIANALKDATPSSVSFTILAGWRLEEIAASLPTTGLSITPEEFLASSSQRYPGFKIMEQVPNGASLEGIFPPGTYQVERETNAEELIRLLLDERQNSLTDIVLSGLEQQGLTIYEGLTLASIVQREAVIADEMPIIASVFHNRLEISMKLETDPTVQYAVGYNLELDTWWTSQLTYSDLEVESPYNTYLYPGLPPTPIASPSLAAIQAVAFPAKTPYYFFRAACDGSGKHNFSETFQQHLDFGCTE
jgi:UPF0755 protein